MVVREMLDHPSVDITWKRVNMLCHTVPNISVSWGLSVCALPSARDARAC